jgi:hypothetical protein
LAKIFAAQKNSTLFPLIKKLPTVARSHQKNLSNFRYWEPDFNHGGPYRGGKQSSPLRCLGEGQVSYLPIDQKFIGVVSTETKI